MVQKSDFLVNARLQNVWNWTGKLRLENTFDKILVKPASWHSYAPNDGIPIVSRASERNFYQVVQKLTLGPRRNVYNLFV